MNDYDVTLTLLHGFIAYDDWKMGLIYNQDWHWTLGGSWGPDDGFEHYTFDAVNSLQWDQNKGIYF